MQRMAQRGPPKSCSQKIAMPAWTPVDDQGNPVRSVRQGEIAVLLNKLRSLIATS
jgi:hypothetical protein